MENTDILTQPVDLPEGEGFTTVHKSVVGAVNELNSELSAARQSASESDLKAQGAKDKVDELESMVNEINLRKGDKGDTGEQGPKGDQGETGPAGQNGADGKSALEIANEIRVSNGEEPFATAEEFIASLKGEAGKDGLNGTDAYVDAAVLATDAAFTGKYVAKDDMKDADGNDIYAKVSDVASKADKDYVDEHVGSKAEATAVEALMTALDNKQDKIAEGTYAPVGDYATKSDVSNALADYTKTADLPDVSDFAEKGESYTKAESDENYYKKEEVDQKILNAQTGELDKDAIDAEINRIIAEDTENVIVSTSELETALANYAKSTDIPDVSGFATKEELENKAMTPGPQGEAGADGKSAFDIAKELNPELADEAAFIASLKGEKGEAGQNGEAGKDGANGKSAFDIAKELNPELTSEADFIASLKGEKGEAGENGEAGQNGSDGKSAFDIAKELNPELTDEAAFVASLKGEKGDAGEKGEAGENGASAFDIAKTLNPELADEAAFIASLKGEKGDAGDQGIQGEQGPQGIQGEKGEQGADGKSAFEIANDLQPEDAKFENEAAFIASLKGAKGDKGEDATVDYDAVKQSVLDSINTSNLYVPMATYEALLARVEALENAGSTTPSEPENPEPETPAATGWTKTFDIAANTGTYRLDQVLSAEELADVTNENAAGPNIDGEGRKIRAYLVKDDKEVELAWNEEQATANAEVEQQLDDAGFVRSMDYVYGSYFLDEDAVFGFSAGANDAHIKLVYTA